MYSKGAVSPPNTTVQYADVEFEDFKRVLTDIIDRKKSGVLKVYRKTFGDPLLYAYFLRGVPVYASSFVVQGKWYEGLLTREEVDDNIFGNLFKYAYDKYGKRFLEHIVAYSKEVLKEVLRALADNGWKVEVEFLERTETHIRESIGITKVTTIEGWAKSLLSIGATGVYIPDTDRVLGMSRGDTLRQLYGVLTERFGDTDVVYSTPFANVFLLHRDERPVLIMVRFSMGFEEVENFKRLLLSTDPVPYPGGLKVGQELPFPIVDEVGKPFAVALRKGKDLYDFVILKGDGIAHVYAMDVEGVFNTIIDLGEKLSAVLYRTLDRIGNRNIPPAVMDMQIRILMMTHPHPDDFIRAAREKFGL